MSIRNYSRASGSHNNTIWEGLNISRELREKQNGHKAAVLWFTGISASGKTTIARSIEHKLFVNGIQTVLLDGDMVRKGLCNDLGFSEKDRKENIRRISEVARLLFEQGSVVICTFISPFREDRQYARSLIADGRFFEIFVKCDIETAKKRDPKGLYQKALRGEIKDFTGISSPFEEPENPEIVLDSELKTSDELIGSLFNHLKVNNIIKVPGAG
jgi:bifunctional enzyme CysN/CysC